MIFYREQRRRVKAGEFLRDMRCGGGHEGLREMLIELGVLESGIADSGAGEDLRARMREASVAMGRAFYRSWRGLEVGEIPRMAFDLPAEVEITVPEGYEYYGLFPESYVDAAENFYREVRPEECVCVGIRSIGTSLSAAVAGAIAEMGGRVRSFTVRPEGDPFDRKVELPDGGRTGHFLIVDEGPGLSGSSFGATARALCEAGVPDSRIVLFPSWSPDAAALASANAREHWARHAKYAAAEVTRFRGWRDLSAGKWREVMFDDPVQYPASHPQHERRKYLRDGVLAKFVGFGARGRACFERARRLHEGGFSTRPIGLADGFLYSEFVAGRVALPPQEFVAHYLAFVRQEWPASESIDFDGLYAMIRANVAETISENVDALARFRSVVENSSATRLDGRMLAHEWIETSGGFLKCDAVDHGDDHFFPGPQDIAWDVAAAQIETGLDPELYARLSGIERSVGDCLFIGSHMRRTGSRIGAFLGKWMRVFHARHGDMRRVCGGS